MERESLIFLFPRKESRCAKILLLIHPRKNDNNEKDNIILSVVYLFFWLVQEKKQ